MDPEIETMLTFTATAWLLAVMVLAVIAVQKMYAFGRDGVERPRRVAFKWLSDRASQFATGAGVFILVLYWFLRIAAEDGWIYTSVFFIGGALFVWRTPNLGRARASSHDKKDE